jgi:hypothetical protein
VIEQSESRAQETNPGEAKDSARLLFRQAPKHNYTRLPTRYIPRAELVAFGSKQMLIDLQASDP